MSADDDRLASVPVVGLCAPSGVGKTTLARRVIGLLCEQGFRVGVVKQARDDFDVDQPGKDSDHLRKAGIERLLLGSERQSALLVEYGDSGAEPELPALLDEFDQTQLDIVLVEGFADAPLAKIELIRATASGARAPRYPQDPHVIAVACDDAYNDRLRQAALPRLDIDDPWAVADFICRYARLTKRGNEQP